MTAAAPHRSTISRRRASQGLAVLKVVVDEAHISALLVGSGFLPINLADNRDAIARALEAYVAASKPALFDV